MAHAAYCSGSRCLPDGMNRMSLPLARIAAPLAALALLAALAACGSKQQPAPPAVAPQAAFVPPPLPEAPTAPWCTRPAESAAFNVAALKSHLMVTAITCEANDKYNGFITHNRSALVQQEKIVEGYFSRNDKRHWDKTRDDYITQLANAQSQRAMVLGDQFCARSISLLDEAQSPSDLLALAASKTDIIPEPMKFSDCASQAATPAPAATSGGAKTTHKKK